MNTPPPDATAAALFGSTRRGVLGLLYSRPEERFYLRQIARSAGTSAGTARRELEQLVAAGLLMREPDGNQVYYRANSRSPIFSELRNIIAKTAGIGDFLRGALVPLGPRVQVAFIFGSVAKGEQQSGSDVDLMVLGDVDLDEAVRSLLGLRERLGREVNPTVYSVAEWKKRVAARQRFILTVLEAPKLFVIGDQRDLDQLAR